MSVAGPSATALAGSAARSKTLTPTVVSGFATGTFWSSRNENIKRVLPQVTLPAGLMTCGNNDVRCALMSHPSGVPDGGGVTGQDPAPVEDDVPGLDAAGVPVLPPPPPVHAATVMSSAHSRASREGRIMTRSV